MLKITTTRIGEDTVIKPEGEINTITAEDFKGAIAKSGSINLIFDFAEVTYITSAALRALLATQQMVDENGGRMSLRNTNAMVNEILTETGFDDIFILE